MRFKRFLFFVSVLSGGFLSEVCAQGAAPLYRSEVWRADNGDGTYTNPILHADYSDPDLVRVGDDYFMTASSFNCSPGLPILHSKDLVSWQLVNYAIRVPGPDAFFGRPQHGKGVWAPCIRHRKGIFYIYWGDPDFGVFMVKTANPFGEWDPPVRVLEGKGIIDASPLWDEDGKAWLVTAWAASRAHVNSLLTIWPLNGSGAEVVGQGRHVYDGHDHNATIEGPKLYQREGWYYIFAPAGGVTNGWQLVLRSKSIYGPYQEKQVLAQGNSSVNGPHQGGWVDTPSGESWFVHFQDKGAYGRILHLQPVTWKEGWPVMGNDPDGDGCGQPVMTYKKPDVGREWPICSPAESDEFNGPAPGLQWQWAANERITWFVQLPDQGFLRLLAYPTTDDALPSHDGMPVRLWDVPNLLMQKFPAPAFTATTKVKLTIEFDAWQGKQTGLVVMGNDYSYLALARDDEGCYLRQILCKNAPNGGREEVVDSVRVSRNEIYLQVQVSAPDAACRFFYCEDGKRFIPIGVTHIAKPELWIGAKVGLFCTAEPGIRKGSYADFDWFRISR